MRNDLTIMPSFSLQPNKAVAFNRIFRRSDFVERWDDAPPKKTKRNTIFKSAVEGRLIKRSSHNLTMSTNAYRTLRKKINWLYYLAKSKHVRTISGKEIYNFKIGFITLTLPSKQRTCTKEVTNSLFNTLLTELRTTCELQNYVWRLEFQKNGNVHYHLVTDLYIDYFYLRKVWNRILKNNGYIDSYKAKHENLSLHQYNQMYNSNGKRKFEDVAKSYAAGKKSNWEQPNSVDVVSVNSKKAIANYISKYFGKSPDGTTLKNDLDDDDNTANIRIWFCSRSLSKLNTVTNFCGAVEYNIFSLVETAKSCKRYIAKYAMIYYFDIYSLGSFARKHVEMILRNYAKDMDYQPSP